MQRVLLAYTGQLSSLICLHYLHTILGRKVIALIADIGQPFYLEPLSNVAIEFGASSVELIDIKSNVLINYAINLMHLQPQYPPQHLLPDIIWIPALVEKLVQLAEDEDIHTIALGCKTTSESFVRFKKCFHSLAPHLELITPLEVLSINNADDEINYAKENKLPYQQVISPKFNIDENIWGTTVNLGYIPQAFSYDFSLNLCTSYLNTPVDYTKTTSITIGFKHGIPVTFNKQRCSLVKMMQILNNFGCKMQIGQLEIIRETLNRKKAKFIYNTPGASILTHCYQFLEQSILSSEIISSKSHFAQKFVNLIYNGDYYHPLVEAIINFVNTLQIYINGTVTLKLKTNTINIINIKTK